MKNSKNIKHDKAQDLYNKKKVTIDAKKKNDVFGVVGFLFLMISLFIITILLQLFLKIVVFKIIFLITAIIAFVFSIVSIVSFDKKNNTGIGLTYFTLITSGIEIILFLILV